MISLHMQKNHSIHTNSYYSQNTSCQETNCEINQILHHQITKNKKRILIKYSVFTTKSNFYTKTRIIFWSKKLDIKIYFDIVRFTNKKLLQNYATYFKIKRGRVSFPLLSSQRRSHRPALLCLRGCKHHRRISIRNKTWEWSFCWCIQSQTQCHPSKPWLWICLLCYYSWSKCTSCHFHNLQWSQLLCWIYQRRITKCRPNDPY